MASWLLIVSAILGWVAFAAWSASFYGQVWLNYQRKHVSGLSFDFLLLNLTGFLCYAAYCYAYLGSGRDWSDVAFSTHAVAVTAFTIFQTQIYERDPSQRVSNTCLGIWSVIVIVVAACLACAIFGFLPWRFKDFSFFVIIGYVKAFISAIKYIPQAVLNFRRKSTVGWSIMNIILDFTGGTTVVLSDVFTAVDKRGGQWYIYFFNPQNLPTQMLGFLSIAFDLLFMFQHYILYPQKKGATTSYLEVEGPTTEPNEGSPLTGGTPSSGKTS